MKRVWIVTTIVLAVLTVLAVLIGMFLWKGGHHALYLADVLAEWLDADDANQTLTIRFHRPEFTVNEIGRLEHHENHQWTLTADSFWTEYSDERVYGLRVEGITAYTSGKNLYLDTGKAYSLPEMPELKQELKRLSLGLLLYGRVTKNGDTYHISMNTEELKLSASVTVNRTVQSVVVSATLPDETVIDFSMTPQQTSPTPIPKPVTDAIDRARTEQPMPLMEPLEVLLPAAENLIPLSGNLKLSISSGILELSETMQLNVQKDKAVLSRKDKTITMPMELPELSSVAMSALLLRNGDFTRNEDGAQFTIILPGATTTTLLETLVPQAADLGITLDDCKLYLCFTAENQTSAKLTAKGSVPFLFTSIPVNVSAKLTID